jgi:hypothetical protein
MNFRRLLGFSLVLPLFAAACGDGGGTGPDDDRVSLAIQSGDAQFGTANSNVADPLQVIITDPVTEEPVANALVTWQIVAGNGATVTPAQSATDANGIASTTLRLGPGLGTYQVEARVNNAVGQLPRFTARAVEAPVITTAPTIANTGDTITLVGRNFSPQADDNLVLFGGFRGRIVSASATQLRVVVPACVPARIVSLSASLGAVTGSVVQLEVRGTTTTALTLARGEVRTIADPAELGCFQLPGITGYTVLLIPQNVSAVAGSSVTLQLAGLAGGATVTNVATSSIWSSSTTPAIQFEERLRARERQMIERAGANFRPQASVQQADCPTPVIGSRCTFQVIDRNDDFVAVSAELKAISTRALIYQDVNAPAQGLTTADFQSLGVTFDDPVYSAVSSAFGTPSDLDNNGKVIILLTPIVNAMTTRGSSGFIAGFFYGCDLVARTLCSGTNSAEIFYTMTADPTGQFSDARSVQSVLRSLPPVLGHEFQHMINFGQRQSTDALWLSEGMAHHAEDVVADVFEARGDQTNAVLFRQQNYTRATRYLRDPSFTSLIAETGTGSLEMRGGAWLFVKYLVGQHSPLVLRGITQSRESSITNVVAQTGKPWSTLMANWAVALYADDAPELAGITVRPEYTFPNINLRNAIVDGGGYPLRPPFRNYEDFVMSETLPASSQAYLTVQATSNPRPFSLNLSGQLGGPFPASAAPQLSILRLR